jgi:hypothetical protein
MPRSAHLDVECVVNPTVQLEHGCLQAIHMVADAPGRRVGVVGVWPNRKVKGRATRDDLGGSSCCGSLATGAAAHEVSAALGGLSQVYLEGGRRPAG